MEGLQAATGGGRTHLGTVLTSSTTRGSTLLTSNAGGEGTYHFGSTAVKGVGQQFRLGLFLCLSGMRWEGGPVARTLSTEAPSAALPGGGESATRREMKKSTARVFQKKNRHMTLEEPLNHFRPWEGGVGHSRCFCFNPGACLLPRHFPTAGKPKEMAGCPSTGQPSQFSLVNVHLWTCVAFGTGGRLLLKGPEGLTGFPFSKHWKQPLAGPLPPGRLGSPPPGNLWFLWCCAPRWKRGSLCVLLADFVPKIPKSAKNGHFWKFLGCQFFFLALASGGGESTS